MRHLFVNFWIKQSRPMTFVVLGDRTQGTTQPIATFIEKIANEEWSYEFELSFARIVNSVGGNMNIW